MRAATEQTLTPGLQLQLYLLVGLLLLPHVLHFPLPVSLFLFAAIGWRLISLKKPQLEPGRWLMIPVTLASILLIYHQYNTLIGRDAGVSLLSVMMVLKTLEVRKRRDLIFTIYIAYFVIITQFLYNQSFLLLLYMLLMLIGHTSMLMAIQYVSPPAHFLDPYRRTLSITLQAMPIALVLFFFFPRLTQPLWHFGINTGAITGISERVSPGSIAKLTQSSETAFRVSFTATPPPRETFYWRALVLWDTDGFNWFTDKERPVGKKRPKLKSFVDVVTYEVFLEPHRQKWLYALDLPISAPVRANITSDFLLQVKENVIKPMRYQGLSYTDYSTVGISANHRRRALQLAEGVSKRQRELVKTWQRGNADAQTIVQQALNHFHQNSFVYTLNPPIYQNNPIDQFLFDAREGFCEHYASAFTQLMRLAGVPARMVIGFQGGEYNQLGDYYTIRNYDAHAWSEVWLEKQGWVRVDPTAAVAPERIRKSIQPQRGSIGEPVSFMLSREGLIGTAFNNLSMILDAAEVNWRRWILGYNRDQQFSVMRRFGMNFLFGKAWTAIPVTLIFSVLALIALRLLQQGRVKQTPVLKYYRLFCHRMAYIGLPRAPQEGPLDYSTRISRLRPDLAAQIREITRLYIGLRYGPRKTSTQRQAFVRQVRRFRPRRISRAG
jgi:transglutaminase-like putative cysteine protease